MTKPKSTPVKAKRVRNRTTERDRNILRREKVMLDEVAEKDSMDTAAERPRGVSVEPLPADSDAVKLTKLIERCLRDQQEYESEIEFLTTRLEKAKRSLNLAHLSHGDLKAKLTEALALRHFVA